jgi:hypothetical protein
VTDPRLPEIRRLEYRDPRIFLRGLRPLHEAAAASNLSRKVRTLRTHELKPWREAREACLFAVGMSELLGREVWVAKSEAQDYDSVTRVEDADGNVMYCPLQIKELVPHYLNPTAELQPIIDGLWRYGTAPNLAVAVHVNRQITFDPSALRIPRNIKVGSLWAFMALSPDQFGEWGLWGNLLTPAESQGHKFRYPS